MKIERPKTGSYSEKTGRLNPYSYLGIAFEFLGILALLPTLGYLLDRNFRDGRIGLFFSGGLALGFGYGVYHLYRRARRLMPDLNRPTKPRRKKIGREGYETDVEGRVHEIQRGLDDINRRIDRMGKNGD